MDINYFLSTKEKLVKILSHLNEIQDIYGEIEIDDYYNIICYNYVKKQMKDYEKKITEIDTKINEIDKFISLHCDHIFVDDYIDINPDRSERITYCSKCQYTLE